MISHAFILIKIEEWDFLTFHCVIKYMIFEFDDNKSQTNLAKHGIDFISAQRLWNDPDVLEIPARIMDEIRHLVIGKIENKHWSATITYRDDKVRIISVRRSRKEEITLYESK